MMDLHEIYGNLKLERLYSILKILRLLNWIIFGVNKDLKESKSLLCRYGHSAVTVTNSTFLIFGGIDNNYSTMNKPLLINVQDNSILKLEEKGNKFCYKLF